MPITHGSLTIPGLVEDINWGEWERPVQYASMFGLLGVTALDGGRTMREFVSPMLIFNSYISESALDLKLGEIDTATGAVETYVERDLSGNIKRTMTNVELCSLFVGIKRYDSDIGWWAQAALRFKQLQPE